jgi:hypothetical protein
MAALLKKQQKVSDAANMYTAKIILLAQKLLQYRIGLDLQTNSNYYY